jgi:hypothetical protein
MLGEGCFPQRWSNGGKAIFPGARFYLLHSLSHLLMT